MDRKFGNMKKSETICTKNINNWNQKIKKVFLDGNNMLNVDEKIRNLLLTRDPSI